MDGYIYALHNPSFIQNEQEMLLKIGKTTRHPEYRLQELYTTGVPTPFNLVWFRYVKDVDFFEKEIHKKLEEWRVSNSREFFWFPRRSYMRCLENIFMSVYLTTDDPECLDKALEYVTNFIKEGNSIYGPLTEDMTKGRQMIIDKITSLEKAGVL